MQWWPSRNEATDPGVEAGESQGTEGCSPMMPDIHTMRHRCQGMETSAHAFIIMKGYEISDKQGNVHVPGNVSGSRKIYDQYRRNGDTRLSGGDLV